MSDTFRVLVQVERVGEDDNDYENMGRPDSIAEFYTFAEATAFIRTLSGWCVYLAETNLLLEGAVNDAQPQRETTRGS